MITDKQTYYDSVISKGGSHPTSIKGFPSGSHKLLFIYPKKGRNRGKGQYMSKWLSWTAHYLPFHQRRKQDAIELFSWALVCVWFSFLISTYNHFLLLDTLFAIYCMHYLFHFLLLILRNFLQLGDMSDKENGPPEGSAWAELKLPDLLFTDTIRELHAAIGKEWDSLQQSACQTAAGRAMWKHVVHDPVAGLLAGETYLKSFYDKINKDRLNNAREISGVILAVRTLWFDSKLEAALSSFNGGEAQVVLLGAGWCLLYPNSLLAFWCLSSCINTSRKRSKSLHILCTFCVFSMYSSPKIILTNLSLGWLVNCFAIR